MPRDARAVAIGFPHHIVHRGNNKGRVFFDKEDRAQYLYLLKKYAAKWNSPLLAYCLMTNHVHLLTRPLKQPSLPKMMQGIALCYTQYVNRKYRRSGRLWETRYYSSIVGEERYLWAVVRYIEQNPQRARITKCVEDYPYSSARAHLQAEYDHLLGEELFSEWQRSEYLQFFNEAFYNDGLKQIRVATRSNKPFGSQAFTKMMEEKLNLMFETKPRGRPKYAGN